MPNAASSAIVLAGGRSSRMGADKATLRLGRRTILECLVAELGRAFEEIVIVAGANAGTASMPAGTNVKLVRDAVAFQGPINALRSGLAAVGGEVAFACACDLPFVTSEAAAALCAMVDDRDAAVPAVGGRLQVLHAAYRKRCIGALDTMMRNGQRRLQDLVAMLDTRIVGEDEMRLFDPELRGFFNLNTRADYERALRMAAEPAGRRHD